PGGGETVTPVSVAAAAATDLQATLRGFIDDVAGPPEVADVNRTDWLGQRARDAAAAGRRLADELDALLPAEGIDLPSLRDLKADLVAELDAMDREADARAFFWAEAT